MATKKTKKQTAQEEFARKMEKLDYEYHLILARFKMAQEQLAEKEQEISDLLAEQSGQPKTAITRGIAPGRVFVVPVHPSTERLQSVADKCEAAVNKVLPCTGDIECNVTLTVSDIFTIADMLSNEPNYSDNLLYK